MIAAVQEALDLARASAASADIGRLEAVMRALEKR
jgi:hypothetical protein